MRDVLQGLFVGVIYLCGVWFGRSRRKPKLAPGDYGVKILSAELAADPVFVDCLAREMRAAFVRQRAREMRSM